MTSKKQYNTLLKTGILLEMYPEMSGIWLDDKSEFERIYEAEQFYTNNLDVIDETYE